MSPTRCWPLAKWTASPRSVNSLDVSNNKHRKFVTLVHCCWCCEVQHGLFAWRHQKLAPTSPSRSSGPAMAVGFCHSATWISGRYLALDLDDLRPLRNLYAGQLSSDLSGSGLFCCAAIHFACCSADHSVFADRRLSHRMVSDAPRRHEENRLRAAAVYAVLDKLRR